MYAFGRFFGDEKANIWHSWEIQLYKERKPSQTGQCRHPNQSRKCGTVTNIFVANPCDFCDNLVTGLTSRLAAVPRAVPCFWSLLMAAMAVERLTGARAPHWNEAPPGVTAQKERWWCPLKRLNERMNDGLNRWITTRSE